jgi:hypothetical protein
VRRQRLAQEFEKGAHHFRQGAPGQGLQLHRALPHAALADLRRMQFAALHPLAHGDLTGNREAAAVQHEAGQRLETVAHQRGLEHHAAVAAGHVEQLAHRGVGARQPDRKRQHLCQRHAAMPGQRMVGPHQREHAGPLAVRHMDALYRGAAVGEADVGIAKQHGFGDLAGLAGLQLELDAGVHRAERDDGARQELVGEARRAGDAHMPALQALQPLDVRHHALGLQRTPSRVRCQQLAGRAGHHAARAALEQRHAQQGLEHGHLPADGGGTDVQPHSCFGQRAAAHHFEKVAQ